ncbi:MAG: NAD(P)-dependent oxidoreductase [Okeania sp. SIO3B5]|uniref:NAD-dependent epimerase/dehydratase family protein n=1 Tax=Okeania sp. SIO3B5 TaxID=2607811 RepID=UPI0013FEF901|nr:NAD(P)-dependent oxidoreductase [Okeania sp. SIO3B5]NEO57010.1 NAD(P)-dependent oxidoreductase [Okeania sp. SIO3B5]
MNSAIIGHTGFVGSNLIRQRHFDAFYNSKNIETIQNKSFDSVICAGVSAVKWLANKEPIQDRENIQKLISCLQQISTQKFILISTVDVYACPIKVDEQTPIILEELQPYGKHRRELECFVQDNFDSLIIRLPGLFGKGIKKNIIYDFLHHNLLDKIHKDSVFQFYDLNHLWADIELALNHQLTLVNFSTEPTVVGEIARRVFGLDFHNQPPIPIARYDMHTRYAPLLRSNQSPYLWNKEQVLQQLQQFVQQFKT